MTPLTDDQLKEIALRRWSSRDVSLIKVVSNKISLEKARGYITEERFLFGKTPDQMERLLGLLPFQLRGGAKLYRLSHLPKKDEFECKGYTHLPGGQPFEFDLHQWQMGSLYPPGGGAPQYRLVKEVPCSLIQELISGQAYVR